MTIQHSLSSFALGIGLLLGASSLSMPVLAAEMGLEQFVGDEPPLFADATAAVDAFKAGVAANDIDGVAKLLGLDPVKLKGAEGIMDTFNDIREGAARKVFVEGDGDRRVINIGNALWPLPFPLVKDNDGKWSFDTYAGLEEIINRRVGENELQAMVTANAYVEAQADYASEDRDDDGVLEYAQRLVSTEGKTDGLYWPIEQGDGDSPAGPFVNQAAMTKAKAGDGYFGYRFRILRGQGSNIAGGRYDYVINDNMIGGFALIAWPVKYAETGVNTFVVNQAGIVYEKDLGPNTEAIASGTARFNPDKTWTVVNE